MKIVTLGLALCQILSQQTITVSPPQNFSPRLVESADAKPADMEANCIYCTPLFYMGDLSICAF